MNYIYQVLSFAVFQVLSQNTVLSYLSRVICFLAVTNAKVETNKNSAKVDFKTISKTY